MHMNAMQFGDIPSKTGWCLNSSMHTKPFLPPYAEPDLHPNYINYITKHKLKNSLQHKMQTSNMCHQMITKSM